MGYYTQYSLEIKLMTGEGGCKHALPPDAKFCPECGRDLSRPYMIDDQVLAFADTFMEYPMRKLLAGGNECWKWYDCEKDMRRISQQFPDYLLTLRGEGEETGDIWVAYFLGGLMQKEIAVITLGEFDPSKLK